MKQHPRTRIVNTAAYEIGKAISHVADTMQLTELETIGILLEEAQRCKKYALRAERHPNDPDKKADEE